METVAPGVARLSVAGFVNVYLVGEPGGGAPWTLVDAGVPGRFETIKDASEARFGKDTRPEAIVLTHGHVDHVGSALALATYWDVPVYAHRRELPYLTGRADYAPKDPTVGGAIAFLSRFLTDAGADLGDRVRDLADDLPRALGGWRVLETPGHSPGHVSLFREADRVLIAGDAVTTVNVDSGAALATRRQEVSRPPTPFTYDWEAARRSVERLAGLRPSVLAAGHGVPMVGPDVARMLAALAEDFRAPTHGRYVPEPARTDEDGIVVSLPPAPADPLGTVLVGAGIAALAAVVLAAVRRRGRNP